MVHIKQDPCALILVGGYGTRLRPLTYTHPKPLVPFVNKPILEHQIEALANAGVTKIILAVNYYSELIMKQVNAYKTKYKISVIYSKEENVLGTAGPLALARKHLSGNFYVLNSDVICNYPLTDMMEHHIRQGKIVTMLTTTLDDPSRYGVVKTHDNSCLVQEFVEKPKDSTLKQINAGIYIFNEGILDNIELKESSLEKDIFPQIVNENMLIVYRLDGYWMDIGQINDYIIGQKMYLDNMKRAGIKGQNEDHGVIVSVHAYDTDTMLVGNINIGKGTTLGDNVVIGKNVKIGRNTIIRNSTVFSGATIGDNVHIEDSIIGWLSTIHSGSTVCGGSFLGKSAVVMKNTKLMSALVHPKLDY